MSDGVIEAIRQIDPCPVELPAPPIEDVWRRLHEDPVGSEPPAPRRRPPLGDVALLLSGVMAIAVALLAIVVLRSGDRAGLRAGGAVGGRGASECRPQVRDGVLPVWARAGFSNPRPRMPHALGASERIAAILWVRLASPPAAAYNNKILWVSSVPVVPGSDLRIEAQHMVETTSLGAPVSRTVSGGPGPSIVNLPAAGCWRLTLRWSRWIDHIDLRYTRPG